MITKLELESILLDSSCMDKLKYVEDYESIYPYDYDIFSYKYICYIQREDFDSSYLVARKAVHINPFSIEANYNFAEISFITENYSDSYLYFLRAILFQERSDSKLIDIASIHECINTIDSLANSDSELKDALSTIVEQHSMSQKDPFKSFSANLVGSLLTCFNGQKYYVGSLDNHLNSYWQRNIYRDALNTKVELFEISSYSNSFEVNTYDKSILPVCINPTIGLQEYGKLSDSNNPGKYYISTSNMNYIYLPSEYKQKYIANKPVVFAKPLAMTRSSYSHNAKKLVLNIFIDSFNYKAIAGDRLEQLMPHTYQYFKDGTICSNYYSTSEWTMPSIATYWTGCRQTKHMNLDENYRMDFMKKTKILSEYFKEAGYVTAKIGGNDSVTPFQGYNRGIDRFVYQYSSQGYTSKSVVADALQHIETFKDANQFVWLDFVDLHDIAGQFEGTILSQSQIPLDRRYNDNDVLTTVKQGHSKNKEHRFEIGLSELDFYLNQLYSYIKENYDDSEILISLFSDHGTAFMVNDGEPFISDQREKIPLMVKGYSNNSLYCDEIIENTDYAAIMCTLAGIEYDYTNTDANLPVFFGGNTAREFAISQSIYKGDCYYGALHGLDFHYYYQTKHHVDHEFRFSIEESSDYLLDNSENQMYLSHIAKYRDILLNEVRHLIKY